MLSLPRSMACILARLAHGSVWRSTTWHQPLRGGAKMLGQNAGPEVSTAEVEKLHSKIGQLLVEWDFLANGSRQLLGTRGKKC